MSAVVFAFLDVVMMLTHKMTTNSFNMQYSYSLLYVHTFRLSMRLCTKREHTQFFFRMLYFLILLLLFFGNNNDIKWRENEMNELKHVYIFIFFILFLIHFPSLFLLPLTSFVYFIVVIHFSFVCCVSFYHFLRSFRIFFFFFLFRVGKKVLILKIQFLSLWIMFFFCFA